MKIDSVNLKAQQALISRDIKKRIDKVLLHGQYILGPEVKELEKRLSEMIGSKYCITCGNGTDALLISLLAINIKPGDEVITPAFSYIAAAEAIAIIGAIPVFVDIDPYTFNLDPKQLPLALSTKTKAIIAVSLFGQCPDFDLINGFAKENNLVVIEDAAQSFGATYKSKKSCNIADISTTSFFPSKPLGCYGDGGAVFTNNDNFAVEMYKIRNHGQKIRYDHDVLGLNSRLDTLQAAVLLAKLEIFEVELVQRNDIAQFYENNLKELSQIITPKIEKANTSTWAQYTLQVQNRDLWQTMLNQKGIPAGVYYKRLVSDQPSIISGGGPFPSGGKASSSVLSIPMNPYLEDRELNYICEIINNIYHELS